MSDTIRRLNAALDVYRSRAIDTVFLTGAYGRGSEAGQNALREEARARRDVLHVFYSQPGGVDENDNGPFRTANYCSPEELDRR